MEGYVLSLYPDFACLAGRCPATCCSGWKIIVDLAAHQRFEQLADRELRQDILANLVEQEGTLRFANQRNGNCAMLDPDGMCRIQKKTSEEMLCHTCRKFPRITARIAGQDTVSGCSLQGTAGDGKGGASGCGTVFVSLAASCPVVAEYILDGHVAWLWLDGSGQLHPLTRRQWGKLCEITAMPMIWDWTETAWKPSALLDAYVSMALDALEVFVHFPEIPYLEHSFDLYELEKPDMGRFSAFFSETEQAWRAFAEHYAAYRYPGRYLECQEESSKERSQQVQGELLLMRMMLCSRYVLRGKIARTDWLEILHWAYRFSVHGKVMAQQVHRAVTSWEDQYIQTVYQNICLRQ